VQRVKTGDGKTRYRVRYYENGRAGARRQATFDRLQDAQFFEASIRRARQLGQLASEVVGSEQTVESFLEEWWEKYAKAYLKPATLSSYAYAIDRWVVPYLGQVRLRDLSRETVDTWVAALRSAGAGAPTVNRALGIFQGVMRRAVEWRRIPANPVVGAPRVPHVRSASIDAHEPGDVELIRARLPLEEATLISVLAYEGLRIGEAFALHWRDVLDERQRPRTRLRLRAGLSDQQLVTPKSGRARSPELFTPVAKDLVELYLALGRPDVRTLVFPNSVGGFQRRQNFRQRVWIPALAKAWPCGSCKGAGKVEKVKCADCDGKGTARYFRLHDLRHTCATLLIYEGRPVTEVAAHLGHSDAGFTARVYAHVFDDAKHRRVKIADAIVAARNRTPRLERGADG